MKSLSGFLELLKAPLKILSQNGKLIAITATIYLILSLFCSILFTKSTSDIVLDLMLKLITLASSRPGTPEFNKLLVTIREEIGIFLGIEVAYKVFYFFVVLFAQTTVMIISSGYYNGTNISSLKELMLKVSKTWTRPFVTSFYIQLLASGCTSFFFMLFLVPTLLLFDDRIVLITYLIIFSILFFTFYIYLSVVWSLAGVVSVFEDTYGLSALGKARELVKGNRLNGFLLNLTFVLVVLIIAIVGSKLSPAMPIVILVIQCLLTGFMSLFQFMAFSEFYFQCKDNMTKSRGLVYSQIPTALLVDENLP